MYTDKPSLDTIFQETTSLANSPLKKEPRHLFSTPRAMASNREKIDGKCNLVIGWKTISVYFTKTMANN